MLLSGAMSLSVGLAAITGAGGLMMLPASQVMATEAISHNMSTIINPNITTNAPLMPFILPPSLPPNLVAPSTSSLSSPSSSSSQHRFHSPPHQYRASHPHHNHHHPHHHHVSHNRLGNFSTNNPHSNNHHQLELDKHPLDNRNLTYNQTNLTSSAITSGRSLQQMAASSRQQSTTMVRHKSPPPTLSTISTSRNSSPTTALLSPKSYHLNSSSSSSSFSPFSPNLNSSYSSNSGGNSNNNNNNHICFHRLCVRQNGQASSGVEICYNEKGDMVKQGEQFIPLGIDTCTQCTCMNGKAEMCISVLCSPPENCRKYHEVTNKCCEFLCLDGDLQSGFRFFNKTILTRGETKPTYSTAFSTANILNFIGVRLFSCAIVSIFLIFIFCLGCRQFRARRDAWLRRFNQRQRLEQMGVLPGGGALGPGGGGGGSGAGNGSGPHGQLLTDHHHAFLRFGYFGLAAGGGTGTGSGGIRGGGLANTPFGYIEPPPPYSFWKPPEQHQAPVTANQINNNNNGNNHNNNNNNNNNNTQPNLETTSPAAAAAALGPMGPYPNEAPPSYEETVGPNGVASSQALPAIFLPSPCADPGQTFNTNHHHHHHVHQSGPPPGINPQVQHLNQSGYFVPTDAYSYDHPNTPATFEFAFPAANAIGPSNGANGTMRLPTIVTQPNGGGAVGPNRAISSLANCLQSAVRNPPCVHSSALTRSNNPNNQNNHNNNERGQNLSGDELRQNYSQRIKSKECKASTTTTKPTIATRSSDTDESDRSTLVRHNSMPLTPNRRLNDNGSSGDAYHLEHASNIVGAQREFRRISSRALHHRLTFHHADRRPPFYASTPATTAPTFFPPFLQHTPSAHERLITHLASSLNDSTPYRINSGAVNDLQQQQQACPPPPPPPPEASTTAAPHHFRSSVIERNIAQPTYEHITVLRIGALAGGDNANANANAQQPSQPPTTQSTTLYNNNNNTNGNFRENSSSSSKNFSMINKSDCCLINRSQVAPEFDYHHQINQSISPQQQQQPQQQQAQQNDCLGLSVGSTLLPPPSPAPALQDAKNLFMESKRQSAYQEGEIPRAASSSPSSGRGGVGVFDFTKKSEEMSLVIASSSPPPPAALRSVRNVAHYPGRARSSSSSLKLLKSSSAHKCESNRRDDRISSNVSQSVDDISPSGGDQNVGSAKKSISDISLSSNAAPHHSLPSSSSSSEAIDDWSPDDSIDSVILSSSSASSSSFSSPPNRSPSSTLSSSSTSNDSGASNATVIRRSRLASTNDKYHNHNHNNNNNNRKQPQSLAKVETNTPNIGVADTSATTTTPISLPMILGGDDGAGNDDNDAHLVPSHKSLMHISRL